MVKLIAAGATQTVSGLAYVRLTHCTVTKTVNTSVQRIQWIDQPAY
ncbi:MAG: hypothetical protein LAN18_10120 [Acidobacteriia bacterium]|nr:hypothetical protein [Terriglobia bacterium]